MPYASESVYNETFYKAFENIYRNGRIILADI